ncbi:MAG: hypothetical protein R3C00_12850 [Hyphomonas sp.]
MKEILAEAEAAEAPSLCRVEQGKAVMPGKETSTAICLCMECAAPPTHAFSRGRSDMAELITNRAAMSARSASQRIEKDSSCQYSPRQNLPPQRRASSRGLKCGQRQSDVSNFVKDSISMRTKVRLVILRRIHRPESGCAASVSASRAYIMCWIVAD